MLRLTHQEQAWLDDYRKAIEEKHPGVVHEMLIYGSKARRQARAESDLDVLLIVKNDGGRLKRQLRMFGLHLVRSGEIEPEWSAYLVESLDDRLAADYDVETSFSKRAPCGTLLTSWTNLLSGSWKLRKSGFPLDEQLGDCHSVTLH